MQIRNILAYSWDVVEVEMRLLDRLAMVALRIRQAEEPLLEEWATPVRNSA
jgi:hypothetical protein